MTNIDIANKQQAYLLLNIEEASRALMLFDLLRNKKFTTGAVKQDNWLEEILLSFVILKIHIIFDKSKSAISLENLLNNGAKHILLELDRQKIIKKFSDLQNQYRLFIEQIQNNRHEAIAHIPKKTKLGVTEDVAKKIRAYGEMLGDEKYKNQKSVPEEKTRFSVGNFPTQEARGLIDKLTEIIFSISCPRTLDRV